ncbi:hypothetical protein HBA92_18950 [Ochrobactrum sp. MR28]|nr:hypothetical protein [Ochrobactrum sp. MR28]MBX8818330.1 hypothetical protein [Ochrobactrum sp. MR31]
MRNPLKTPANRKMSTTPIAVPKSTRIHTATALTSLPAGKMVPIAAFPLLREDSVISGRLRFNFESMETAEILMNAINVRVMAYLVPTLAFDRFEGSMDQLNRSWSGEAFKGLPVVPYVETKAFGASGANQIYKYLGLHAKPTAMVNTMYLEAYNQIWNFRAKNRSGDLTLRERLATDLAPAFWTHERFKHIVPDFDQAVIDGEVVLNVANAKLPVRGISIATGMPYTRNSTGKDSTGATVSYTGGREFDSSIYIKGQRTAAGTGANDTPDVWAELQNNGVTLSLSNIELARKTQAFAKLREQYHGHSDEWIINMLMDGLTIPEQAFAQPMLIGEKTTVFGMSKRYASDAANLTESVVNGATFLDLSIQLPTIPTGGVIMVVAEVTPDQIFERQKDPFLHIQDAEQFPHYLRDTLDPEKVEAVPNDYVDVDHDTPNATFGYAPLNYPWNIEAPRIGGRFYRPDVDAGFDEDRQRIWAVETKNPTLSTDFYLCTNMHTKPFVVTNQDPFECVTQGDLLIRGNTVFGGVLHEATNDYDKVMEVAPQDRIVKQ